MHDLSIKNKTWQLFIAFKRTESKNLRPENETNGIGRWRTATSWVTFFLAYRDGKGKCWSIFVKSWSVTPSSRVEKSSQSTMFCAHDSHTELFSWGIGKPMWREKDVRLGRQSCIVFLIIYVVEDPKGGVKWGPKGSCEGSWAPPSGSYMTPPGIPG